MDVREREFDNLKLRLEEHMRALRHRINAIQADKQQDAGPRSADLEEQAQEAENDEVLEQLDSQTRDEYVRVDAALKRMGAGEYGECVDCGEEIQLARLKAIPWAFRCVECARAHEG